jgi:murein DD-endopeptidase MepM/ murein hydrolase activator NlpD
MTQRTAAGSHGGYHIVQDVGDNFAFYAHLKTGNITVKPSDDPTTDQQIAALGNTGNTDAPHLHSHLIHGPNPLASNGLPFVIDKFPPDQRLVWRKGSETLFTGQFAPLQPRFAARDQSEASPLVLDIMNYAVGQ